RASGMAETKRAQDPHHRAGRRAPCRRSGDTDIEGSALSLEEAAAYASRARGERKRPSSGWAALTPTELVVVALAAQGQSYDEIGPSMKNGDSTHLDFEWPEPVILRLVLRNRGKLNSVTSDQHRELSRIWNDIDLDPEVRVVIVTGADGVFSAGGDFGVIEAMV